MADLSVCYCPVADNPGQLLLLVGVLIHEPFEGLGLFNRVQVLADEVLHQRDFGVVVVVDEDGWDGSKPRLPRRSPATTYTRPVCGS
jgi:hypothetical protein